MVYLILHRSNRTVQPNGNQPPPAKAAIVDQLGMAWPNPNFIKECTAILQGAGYAVDYFKGEEVTIEFYRTLPTCGYDLIVLRVHSAYIHEYLSLAMFTSEPHTKERYVYEQLRNRVACGYLEPYRQGDPRYLVITDKFVRFSMQGLFKETLIVMMGCTGIKKMMATAFLEKGAKAYIGWDGLVSAPHTDRTTIELLKNLVVRNQTVAKAVAQTMKDVGRDPQFKSRLLFWPIQAGTQLAR
jgi:hypothetical protein